MQHQEAAFPAAVLLPEAQAARPALLQHTEDRPPAAVHHPDTAVEVHHLQPAAVRRRTTEVHRTAVEVHLTIAAVRLPAAVTAEEVRTLPAVHHTAAEVHRQVVTAEAEVHPADTDDNRTT